MCFKIIKFPEQSTLTTPQEQSKSQTLVALNANAGKKLCGTRSVCISQSRLVHAAEVFITKSL
jgi:hypothetical protein